MTREELIAWRKGRCLTQADLGKLLSRSRQTIINWEQGTFAIPDDLMVQLEKLAPIAAKLQEDQTSKITPAAFPHLFTFRRDVAGYIPSPLHPNSLARRGLLGFDGCCWFNANSTAARAAHPDLLQSHWYAKALRDFEDGVKHPGVRAMQDYYRADHVPAAWTSPEGVRFEAAGFGKPWPTIVFSEATEPMEGFNSAIAFPRPLPPGAHAIVAKPLPDGFYWDANWLRMVVREEDLGR
jgi:DNA-binding XRE family transcriptional regulator